MSSNETWSAGLNSNERVNAQNEFNKYCILVTQLMTQNNQWPYVDDRPVITHGNGRCKCGGNVYGFPKAALDRHPKLVRCPGCVSRSKPETIHGAVHNGACAFIVRALQKATTSADATNDEVAAVMADVQEVLSDEGRRR